MTQGCPGGGRSVTFSADPGGPPGDLGSLGRVSRFWIWIQVAIVVMVLAAAIIAIVKL